MSNYKTCKTCMFQINENEMASHQYSCPKCGAYFSYHAMERIQDIADINSYRPLSFAINTKKYPPDEKYKHDLQVAQEKTGLDEAIICGRITIGGIPIVIGVMDNRFMMASMGHIVGERVCHLFRFAIQKRLPVVLFCCSGGARMQEGIISLMQMEKTAAMAKKHNDAGLLYISVLTNPTMGGVTASFATLADVILAENGAMIGFAGARVIEQNTGEKLPPGFQSAAFQKEHGFVDAVLNRNEIRPTLAFLLRLHHLKRTVLPMNISWDRISDMQHCEQTVPICPWDQVAIARSKSRPTSLDYISRIFPDFFELHGDRISGDDHAVVAGLATFYGLPITVIGQQKGKKDPKDAIFRNFGMPSPCGYRKAIRLAKQAEKFDRPIVFFVDTIGAACGSDAESKGQGNAIAEMLYEMSAIRVPVYSIVIGEGGSGGALAFAVGNEVDILENAVYSIITPEGYASIVWKDSSRAAEAAAQLKMTSSDLYDLHVVEKIIPEYLPVSISNMEQVCNDIVFSLHSFLSEKTRKRKSRITQERFMRFTKY